MRLPVLYHLVILYNTVENCFSGVTGLGHYVLYGDAKYSCTYIDQPQRHFNVTVWVLWVVPVHPAGP